MSSLLNDLQLKSPILLTILKMRDRDTYLHSVRVGRLARDLARHMGFPRHHCAIIGCVGCLHDIGKIAIPDAILLKNGPLTSEEYEVMKSHATDGARLVRQVFGYDLPGVRHHHERWDGNGYHLGLAGKQIDIEARIISVADAFDAMVNDRPYRKGMSREKALFVLQDGAGSQWDPAVVEAFVEMLEVYDGPKL